MNISTQRNHAGPAGSITFSGRGRDGRLANLPGLVAAIPHRACPRERPVSPRAHSSADGNQWPAAAARRASFPGTAAGAAKITRRCRIAGCPWREIIVGNQPVLVGKCCAFMTPVSIRRRLHQGA